CNDEFLAKIVRLFTVAKARTNYFTRASLNALCVQWYLITAIRNIKYLMLKYS
ncbi:MAG: hypothetical protein ACI8RD_008525, partial [Bacillariaceae sp.]